MEGFYKKNPNPNDGKIECPVCHSMVDFLVGDDILDGRRGCEKCWKPPSIPRVIPKTENEVVKPE